MPDAPDAPFRDQSPHVPPVIEGVETAVPALVGYTERATDQQVNDLRNVPTRVESWADFERYFGGVPDESRHLRVEIRQTTRTVGAPYDPADVATTDVHATFDAARPRYLLAHAVRLFFANGGGACVVVSVGGYRNRIALPALRRGVEKVGTRDDVTLLLVPDSRYLPLPESRTLHDAALGQAAEQAAFLLLDLPFASADQPADEAVAAFRAGGIGTEHLRAGAVYGPDLLTTLPLRFDEATVPVRYRVTDPAGVAPAGVPPAATVTDLPEPLRATARAALASVPHRLPPGGAVAGVYARVDRERGVWKAPASVSLRGVVGPSHPLTDAGQERWNVDPVAGKSINALRRFPGKGTLVWGARTLAGNDNEWRYVSVRRFVSFVEASVGRGTRWAVFEPNEAGTWTRVRASIENFLNSLWRQGALAGTRPADAFFVRCGLGQTMTARDVGEGRLIVEIGLAAVRPAEFLTLRLAHRMATD
jgi:phage tail sheath protein FI